MTPERAIAILEEQRRRERLASLDLETVLTDKDFAGVDASDLQVAITRAADGRELDGILQPEALQEYFGTDEIPVGLVVKLVVLICGVRSGKSFLASCAAIKGCLTADLSALKQHEIPRFAIVAPTVDNAEATFTILAGIVRESQVLSKMVTKNIAGELRIRRGDGRIVEIVVVAAHRGAVTVRSRWLIGFCLEEAALFGERNAGAAVTAEEILRAAETRLVPGSQGWIISSPFGEQGLLWNLHKDHFGKPGRTLVVHAPTLAMNPGIIDPAEIEAIRARDPDAAAREYDAKWLDADTALLTVAQIDRCTRRMCADVPWDKGHHYIATMDPATRGNSWTLTVWTRARRVVRDVERVIAVCVCARQWTGSKSKPLDPKVVFGEIAEVLAGYRLKEVWSDEYGSDFARRIAADVGVDMHLDSILGEERLSLYKGLGYLLADGEIELHPEPYVRQDLKSIKKIARQGNVAIVLPITADGRHCDFAPAHALFVKRGVDDPDAPVIARDEGEAHFYAEMARLADAKLQRNAGRGPTVDRAPRFAGRFGR